MVMITDYGILAYPMVAHQDNDGRKILVVSSHVDEAEPTDQGGWANVNATVVTQFFLPSDGSYGPVVSELVTQNTQSGCSLAFWQDKIWLAFLAHDNTNRIVVCSSSDGGSSWSPTNLVQNANQVQSGQSQLAPSLGVFKNQLWVSFISNDNDNRILLCSAENDDGTTWSNNMAIPGQSAKGAPWIGEFADRLWAFFISNDTHNRLLYCTWDGHTWSNDQLVQNPQQKQLSQSTPSAVVFKDQLWVSFISNDTHNTILLCSWNGREWSNNYW
jgi:hypothetical protein